MSAIVERENHELHSAPAIELAGLVQRREVSPVEIVQAHLDRIQNLDSTINAFQVVRAERALDEARALEGRLDLSRLPLAGVPVAIKDNVDVGGEPSRHGSRATPPEPARDDDDLVRRIRQAGGIIIGKTRMPELAVWPFTASDAYGVTRNPWNPERTAGGSTGGGGAAVVAGMAALALGSDGGGSIRVPAACCGIVGLKPGPGIVPLARGAEAHWLGMTAFGPLARTVADTAVLLDVLSGRNDYRALLAPSTKLRIAVSTKSPTTGARIAREVKDAVTRTGALLGDGGHTVTTDTPPYPASLGWRFMRRWLPGIAEDADVLMAGSDALEGRTRKMVRAGHWLQRRGLARPAAADPLHASMARWFANYDVLIMPTLASTPVPVEKWQGQGWLRTTFGVANWILTTPWNLVGFTAMSIPAGLSSDGLPLAVQLVGPPGSERTLLSVAGQIGQLRPWPHWKG